MTTADLLEIIRHGENSGVEFESEGVRPENLAKVAAAFLNLEGGRILLGIEDNGSLIGLKGDRKKIEEWVAMILRDLVQPAVLPYWETVHTQDDRIIGVITLPKDAPDKPYKAKRGGYWVTMIRVGSITREASREEEALLYAQSGQLQHDRKPVPGSTLADLDLRRLRNYFQDFRHQDCPDLNDHEAWERLLVNTEYMAEDRGRGVPSVAGILLFGTNPKPFLPQSGMSAVAYPGMEKGYNARARQSIRGPLVSLFNPNWQNSSPDGFGKVIETGVIEQALDFIRRNTDVIGHIEETGQRTERWDYPLESVREAIVNSVAHRDYTIGVTDIELALYSDRLEILSPGRLPNTVTVNKMRSGYRASRNELVKEALRDYRYIEATGMGVPRKIIAGMLAHNGKEPDLIEEEDRFMVRLWR